MVPKTVLETKICLVIRTRHPTIGGEVPYNWRRGTLQLVAGYPTIGGIELQCVGNGAGVRYNWWRGTLQLMAGYATIGGNDD